MGTRPVPTATYRNIQVIPQDELTKQFIECTIKEYAESTLFITFLTMSTLNVIAIFSLCMKLPGHFKNL